MKESLIFICLIFSFMACYGVDHKWQDETSPQLPMLAKDLKNLPPQKIALPQKFIDALAASRRAWEHLKKESNNTYSYRLESGVPGWTPNRYQTIIEVEQGALADFTVEPIEGGINDEMRGHFPAQKTLDELYDECATQIIPNLKTDQWFVLDFFKNGVLASCRYEECGLMDSEGKGIELKALALERTKNFGPQHSVRMGRLSYDCQ